MAHQGRDRFPKGNSVETYPLGPYPTRFSVAMLTIDSPDDSPESPRSESGLFT
jgi:hypothetical protein